MRAVVERSRIFVLTLGLALGSAACSEKASRPSDPGEAGGAGEAGHPASASVVDAGPTDRSATARPDAGPARGAAGPYNVLLVTVDSLRADMPWAGYARPIAPRLAELHRRSVSFSNAYATSSFTSKSIPGMLTGRYPSELTRTGSFFTKYLAPDQFVCTHLALAHVPCVGGHAHMYFGPGQSGFEAGFSTWKIVPGITFDYQTDPHVTSNKLTPLAISILKDVTAGGADAGAATNAEGSTERPFFAWFHFMDPHDEYKGHDESPHFGKRARDLYDEEVFYTDLWIGKLLDFVAREPWSAKTAIIVTADHGEAFGEHGITRHAHEVWEELVHVPFFVYLPGVAPRVVETTRGHADLAPTILDLLGAKTASALPGTSLVPEIRGEPAAERDVVVDLPEDDYNERRRALIHGRTKLIAFGDDTRFSLFDLASDPKELHDLMRDEPALATEMRARYRDVGKTIRDVAPRGGIPKKKK